MRPTPRYLLATFVLVLLSVCHPEAQITQTPEKALVESLFLDAWNKQDYRLIEASGADTITMHIHGQSMRTNVAELKGMVAFWKRAYPDLMFEVHHLIQEGDLVAVNLTYTGTHSGGDWWGIPATGNKISVSEMMFFRFENGVLQEAWETYDEAGQRRQLEKQ